jgi:hypothetical protein
MPDVQQLLGRALVNRTADHRVQLIKAKIFGAHLIRCFELFLYVLEIVLVLFLSHLLLELRIKDSLV